MRESEVSLRQLVESARNPAQFLNLRMTRSIALRSLYNSESYVRGDLRCRRGGIAASSPFASISSTNLSDCVMSFFSPPVRMNRSGFPRLSTVIRIFGAEPASASTMKQTARLPKTLDLVSDRIQKAFAAVFLQNGERKSAGMPAPNILRHVSVISSFDNQSVGRRIIHAHGLSRLYALVGCDFQAVSEYGAARALPPSFSMRCGSPTTPSNSAAARAKPYAVTAARGGGDLDVVFMRRKHDHLPEIALWIPFSTSSSKRNPSLPLASAKATPNTRTAPSPRLIWGLSCLLCRESL